MNNQIKMPEMQRTCFYDIPVGHFFICYHTEQLYFKINEKAAINLEAPNFSNLEEEFEDDETVIIVQKISVKV